VLAALAVLLMMSALMPPAAPTTAIIVAARALRPGDVVTTEAIGVMELPTTAVPPGAMTTPGSVVGRIALGPVAVGEPLTETRLLTAESAGEGRVGVPIRVADLEIAGLLTAGDVIDVVSIVNGTPRRLASEARVVTVPRRAASFGSASSTGAVVIVAVTPESALTLAAVTTPTGIIIRSSSVREDPPVVAASGR
jgi:Flp pilus assembly protein CpaB